MSAAGASSFLASSLAGAWVVSTRGLSLLMLLMVENENRRKVRVSVRNVRSSQEAKEVGCQDVDVDETVHEYHRHIHQ